MQLKDLKRGMRCTRRDGKMFVVEEVVTDNGTVFHRGELNFSYLSDDLISRMDKRDGDIMIVEDITVNGFKVIWERTVEDREEQKAWNNLMKLLNNSGLIETNYELYEEMAYELDLIGKFLFKEGKSESSLYEQNK